MSHYSIEFDIPLYCCQFLDSDRIALGGGGGTSKSGITNKLFIIKINSSKNQSFEKLEDFHLPKGQDAPMSLDFDKKANQLICGINSPKSDRNEHLRTYSIDKKSKLKPSSARQIFIDTSEEDYQKLTRLSDSAPKFLAIGGTNNQLDILTYPNFKHVFSALRCDAKDKECQLMATDFHQNGSQFLLGSTHFVQLYSTKTKSSKPGSKRSPAALIRQFDPPQPSPNQSCTFRNARYGRGKNSQTLYTIVNYLPLSRMGPRQKPRWGVSDRKAVLISWNIENGSAIRTKAVSNKPVTAFDVSPNGDLLAFASSDLSVGILDASSLRSLLSILHAHEFPVTGICFSPDNKRVVSCSADKTVRVIEIREDITTSWSSTTHLLFIAFLLLFLAILFQLTRTDSFISKKRI
ncbi:hypothetical protein O181_007374 [Austropuccinia psidii MF-1]|uniref:Anaphase-promoting complex subunit 4 WD40 domain-containing protein n=1 Tax=Austropuccinia psidii MF-1 TaxID=1389203 RepID=A0A9Q3BLU2_9BASI|nr:hypothetical protein [Austropuccinia psidii MF-1]